MSLISNKIAYFGIITMALIVGYKLSDIPKNIEYAKPLQCNITSFDLGLNKTLVDVNNQQCNLKVTIDQDYQSYPIGDAMIQVHIAQVIRHNNMVHEKEPFAHINELKIHNFDSKLLGDELMGEYAHGVIQFRLSSNGVVLTHELNHALYYGSAKREFMGGLFYSQFTASLGNKSKIDSISDKNYANIHFGYEGFVDSQINRYNEFWAYGSEYLHYPTKLIKPETLANLSKLKQYTDRNIKKGFYTAWAIENFNYSITNTFNRLNVCGPDLYYSNPKLCAATSKEKLYSLKILFNKLEGANPDLGLQQQNNEVIAYSIGYCLLEMFLYFLIGYITYRLSL
jgi:hypothetical protein